MGYAVLFITVLAVVMQCSLAADVDCKKRPARIDPTTCCKMPEIITHDIKEKCKEFLKPPPPAMSGENSASDESRRTSASPNNDGRRPHHHGPPMHSCFMTCVLNETGIISGMDGKLDDAKLSAYLKDVLKNSSEFIPIMETSFKTCSAEVQKFREKMQEKMKNRSTTSPLSSANMPPPHCPPSASHLMGCVFKETLINCPTSVWSNTKECNEMRDHMKNCKPKHGDSMEDSTEVKM